MVKFKILLLVLLGIYVDKCRSNTDIVSTICLRVPTLWFCKPPAVEPPEILRPIPPPVPSEFLQIVQKTNKPRRMKAERILRDTADERRKLRELERFEKARRARQEINGWKKIVINGPDFWKQFIPKSTKSYDRKVIESLETLQDNAFNSNSDYVASIKKQSETEPSDYDFLDTSDIKIPSISEIPEKPPYPTLVQDYCAVFELHFYINCFRNAGQDVPGSSLRKAYNFCISYENACIRQVYDRSQEGETQQASSGRTKRETSFHLLNGLSFY